MRLKKEFLIVLVVVIFSIFAITMIHLLREKLKEDIGENEDFFEKVAKVYYYDNFSGVVVNKYIDSSQHNFKKIVIKNSFNQEREIRLDYEWHRLFHFIEEGDSLSKKEHSLGMRLKRDKMDTLIRLNFSNLKDSEYYIEFLHSLDSIYN